MYIKNIKLKNFRNYEELSLEFHEKVNIIRGINAQGKTNLLESIYLSSFGKSFRTNKDSELIQFNKDFCKVLSTVETEDDELTVDFFLNKEGRKEIKLNNVRIKSHSELLKSIFIVVFSPDDLKIVKDSPEKRRRFIDKELSSIRPSYYNDLYNYKKVLKQRNMYLKERNINQDILSIWDEQLVVFGAKIIQKRKEFIEKLNKISKNIHYNITSGRENLLIEYDSTVKIGNDLQDQEVYLMEALEKSRKKDIDAGNTSTGPHKDDLKIMVNDINARIYGSQGQQRTAALSLKLAELNLIKEETSENAILLLDDVLSELDHNRQIYLIKHLEEIQTFITSAEISDEMIAKLPQGYEFYVSEGKVTNK